MMNGNFVPSSESRIVEFLLELARGAYCESHSNSVKLEKIDLM